MPFFVWGNLDLDLWLLTLIFKLLRARDQTRLPCEFHANQFSGSGDISHTNKKVTDSAKNRTLRSLLRAVKIKLGCTTCKRHIRCLQVCSRRRQWRQVCSWSPTVGRRSNMPSASITIRITPTSIHTYTTHMTSYQTALMSATMIAVVTRMWANAQSDGRPAEHRWRPLFNAAKFGWRPLLDAVQ